MGILSRAVQLVASGDSAVYNRVLEVIKTIRFSASPRLYGRTSAGAGTGEEIEVGTGLSLASGVISSTVTGNATHTGDATGSAVLTLATVNSNVGTFGSSTNSVTFTVNAKGLITSASQTPNAVTSATTSDGTCALSVASLASVGSITTSGANSPITTSGANSNITTQGVNASIGTSGADAVITTEGINALIYTEGANASISTLGANANITTDGGAYIQTTSTFKISGGGFVTTLSGTQTANRAIAFPNASGTVALLSNITGTNSGTNTGDQTTIVGITGTTAQFNTALTDGDFATLAGSETLTNKTLTSPAINSGIIGTAATFNATSYTYGTDAAAAHRTALGLGTAAIQNAETFAAGTLSAVGTIEIGAWENVTVDFTADTITSPSHGLTGYDSVFVASTGTLPAPLAVNTRYFIVSATTNNFKLSATVGGSAINLTTNGTGVVRVYANRYGSGNVSSIVLGTGNALTSAAGYSARTIVLGSSNTVTSLGPARVFGLNNTVTGGFGTSYVIGSDNGSATARGVIVSGNGLNFTIGSICSGGGQYTINTGYHNDVDLNAQGAFTMGGGVDADWWGCLTRHSHSSSGGFCRVIGEMSLNSGASYAGGELEFNFSVSNGVSATAVPNIRMCNSGFGIMQADFDFLIVDLSSGAHMAAKRRVTWTQPSWTQGTGLSQVVTPDSTLDTLTFTAHGFTNNTIVYVTTTDTMPSGLLTTTPYYIVGATANTFQLSLTSGGLAVNFTTNGTGVINVSQVPPPIITAIEVIGTDVGSNGGLAPAAWALRFLPVNRRFVTGQLMYNSATYAGSTPSSFPYLHVTATLPASGVLGFKGTAKMDCNVMKF